MQILVTGGAGFIGSHIVDALVEKNYEVIVLDNLSAGKKENVNSKAEFIFKDIRDDLSDIFKRKIDCVIHHAAQLSVVNSVENPKEDAEVNILGLLNLLQNSVKYNVSKFVFASSGGAIYGDTTSIPTKEDDEKNPESPYGISKLTSEYYLDFFRRIYGLKCVVLRYSNVYGPRQRFEGEGGVVSIFSNLMLNDKNPKIYGDGNQTRDYVYVADVVKANLAAINLEESGFFNVGTGKETSVNNLVECLKKNIGFNGSVQYLPARPGELLKSCLNISKAERILVWKPEYDLERGLKETVDWFKLR